ncbi:hypothetical protein WICPIJ_008431 [Wickerhamomyces pijperi]|uniref:Uncharacterized protein n=1 Tax=Wickerhamomyces pijperi TaxID=599730 RepID=A0A9P8PYR6_WICPI|nr:hypothetical protein WICPIJ_008431 [Wickerhamomyces pijperi]
MLAKSSSLSRTSSIQSLIKVVFLWKLEIFLFWINRKRKFSLEMFCSNSLMIPFVTVVMTFISEFRFLTMEINTDSKALISYGKSLSFTRSLISRSLRNSDRVCEELDSAVLFKSSNIIISLDLIKQLILSKLINMEFLLTEMEGVISEVVIAVPPEEDLIWFFSNFLKSRGNNSYSDIKFDFLMLSEFNSNRPCSLNLVILNLSMLCTLSSMLFSKRFFCSSKEDG